jgi:hypothetical protein
MRRYEEVKRRYFTAYLLMETSMISVPCAIMRRYEEVKILLKTHRKPL